MQSPYIGNNVGSNWSLPPGYYDTVTAPGQIYAQGIQTTGQNLNNNILQIMQRYEGDKKTQQQANAISKAIKAIGEAEGIDPKFLQAASSMQAGENWNEYKQRSEILLQYLGQAVHDKRMMEKAESRGQGSRGINQILSWEPPGSQIKATPQVGQPELPAAAPADTSGNLLFGNESAPVVDLGF